MNPAPKTLDTGLDRWLKTPWRRMLLVTGAVLVAAALTGWQFYDVAQERYDFMLSEFGRAPFREPDFGSIYRFQLLSWGLWGIAFEPILLLARLLSRLVPHWLPVVLLHVPLSYGVSRGVLEVEEVLGQEFFQEERGEGERRPPPPGGENRDERPLSERLGPDGDVPRDPQARPPQEREGRGDRPQGRGGRRRPSRRWFDNMIYRRNRQARGIAIYWVILGIGTSASVFLRSRAQEREKAELELGASQLETQLARAHVDALKGQLQPHFLFNALHTVGGLVRARDEQGALKTLSSLGGLLRQTLDLGSHERIPLRDELEVAERYLTVEGTRFGDRLEIVVDAADDALDALVPALCLLPLVENAVRHGIEPRTEGGTVEVSAVREGSELVIEVQDSGAGFPEAVLRGETPADGRSHIGLSNSRKRLAVMYPDSHTFELANVEQSGARVSLRIPFETSDA